MAIGIFRKLGDFFSNAFQKVMPVVRGVGNIASSVLGAIPHPVAQSIGAGINTVNQTLGNLMDRTGLGGSSLPSLPGSANGVSDLIKFSKV